MEVSEKYLTAIRFKLNENKIKLWLPPYTQPGFEKGQFPEALINELCLSLSLSKDIIEFSLEHFRLHAIQKISQREEELSKARIKLKLMQSSANSTNKHQTEKEIELKGIAFVKDLVKEVFKLFELSNFHSVKLIYKGNLLKEDIHLSQYAIANRTTILVLVTNISDANRQEDRELSLNQTKRDAELLAAVQDDDLTSQHYLEVQDQQGRVLRLPPWEHKALAVAMALHEKGRTKMKTKDYQLALSYFLEADQEFQRCTSEFLKCVDNYALLNLDIVWSYLCLGNITELPDAEKRLAICQECFHQSYGPNLERLQAVKGSFGQEAALLARLHLLQAIAAFYKGETGRAQVLLDKLKDELLALKVDDEKLAQVISFGYNTAEARIALRSCFGNVESAVYKILKKREEKMRQRKEEREKRKKNLEKMKLGKTVNGEWVNSDFFNQLIVMGFSNDKSKQALQKSNNSISLAVQLLQDDQELNVTVDQSIVAQLVSMGFDPLDSEEALRLAGGVLEIAQDALVNKLGLDTMAPGASRNQNVSLKDAAERMAEDITGEDDYLDLNMEEEEEFMQEYLMRLK